MYDIFYIASEKDARYEDLKQRFPLLKFSSNEKKGDGFFLSQKKSLTKFFWVIDEGFDIDSNFNFDYVVPEWDSKYVHIFKQINGKFGGLYLIPKDYCITQKEAEYTFFICRKDIDIIFGHLPSYDRFIIETPEDFFEAQKKCKTTMFYAIEKDYKIKNDFAFEVPKWDLKYVHTFKEKDQKDGIVHLIPKNYPITKKEAEHNFFISKKEIFENISQLNYDKFIIYKPEDYFSAQEKCKTSMFYAIDKDYTFVDEFEFNILVENWDKKYVHVFKKQDGEYGGLALISKDYPITKKEAEYSFFVNKKEVDIIASKINYDRFVISSPEDYFSAQEKCKTSMFYAIDKDYTFVDEFEFNILVENWDKKYVQVFKTSDGVFGKVYLISKDYPITKKEAEYSFFVNKKEVDIIASKINYDRFVISSPEDYFSAQEKSKTSMFYTINRDYHPIFNFDYVVPDYEKTYVNVFKTTTEEYGEVLLIPKDYIITKNEAKHSFFINKKELNIVASKLQFDIVFISYNEPNADENYEKLKERFPYAQRIHGIKGIHQAHIAAAKKAETSMFWVVDGDAIIENDFDFYLEVSKWDRDAVHVFKSRNPINNLVYGYGGVKLLPTKLVLSMDITTVDMTTSISNKFISIDQISNITAFNTDAFSTWKSAFRECVKLSSKVIDGQVDIQTQERLDIWCNVGIDKPFGEYAIKGALMGTEFGKKYAHNKDMLKKINDWNWLEDEFNK